jgi:UDP-N-acetylenolpyruvoylglucosamine reductase
MLSHNVINDYSLQGKHLFKKKAGNAKHYFQLWFNSDLENDLYVLHQLYKANIPFRIYGAHTNLYITENGYDGLFVDVSTREGNILFCDNEKKFTVSSNVPLSEFIVFAMDAGYDFSAFAGVPGLIGGGVVGNSSWSPSGKDFRDYTKEITFFNFESGETIRHVPDESFFGERDSYLKQQNKTMQKYFVKEIVLQAEYLGESHVREKYNAQMEKRGGYLRIGFEEGTAGSLWSNVHIKKSIGTYFPLMLRETPSINADFNGARYSKESMFFTTESNTTDEDVAKLFVHTLSEVKKHYGIALQKEIILLDRDGEIDLDTYVNRYS